MNATASPSSPIHADQVRLREFRKSDFDAFYKLINEKEVADSTFSIPHPMPFNTAQAWFKHYLNPTKSEVEYDWAIVEEKSDRLVGMINLHNVFENINQAEIGFWVGKPYWNHGYATQALTQALQISKHKYAFHHLVARLFPQNTASQAVLRKTGFLPYRTFRCWTDKKLNWTPVKMYRRDLGSN